MKALTLTEAGGPQKSHLAEHPLPEPAPNEVRVKLRAAALNHREIWISQGMYPGLQLPCTLGADGAGVVEAMGAEVDTALLGQEVVLYPGLDWGDDPAMPRADFGLLGMPGPGTIAEYICVRADRIAPKPQHLSFAQAAALPLASLTAWRALTTKAAVRTGDTVLITGAGGGVASAAMGLARAMGATVYVTSGNDATLDWAREQGAAGGVNYRAEKWGKELALLSGGVDVVIDGAPSGGFAEYARALNPLARVVVYGSTGGHSFPVIAAELFLKNLVLTGTNVGTLAEFAQMLDFVANHRLEPAIDRVFDFADSVAAFTHLAQGHGIGKTVIEMNH